MRPVHDNRPLRRTSYFTALQGQDNNLAERKNDFGVPATILFSYFGNGKADWKARIAIKFFLPMAVRMTAIGKNHSMLECMLPAHLEQYRTVPGHSNGVDPVL
jgi:hypothetical protein